MKRVDVLMRKRWRQMSPRWKWFISLVLIICLFLIIFVTIFYWQLQTTLDAIYEDYKPSLIEPPKVAASGNNSMDSKQENVKPLAVLLLGADERQNDKGRTDTIMLLTINPQEKKTKILSIPRDTLTEIEGYSKADKINHAYAYGGAGTTKTTVEQLLQIPIDYVVTVNMEGFVAVVNEVNGVTVTNPFSFTYEGQEFDKGELNLTGDQAILYVRMRYDDPNGDFGRQDRQKAVVGAVLEKLASPQSLLKLPTFQALAKEHVRMNIKFEDIPHLHKHYRESLKQVESIKIENGHGEMRKGVYYYILDEVELENIRKELQTFIAF